VSEGDGKIRGSIIKLVNKKYLKHALNWVLLSLLLNSHIFWKEVHHVVIMILYQALP
jgi:hypothetical protein